MLSIGGCGSVVLGFCDAYVLGFWYEDGWCVVDVDLLLWVFADLHRFWACLFMI